MKPSMLIPMSCGCLVRIRQPQRRPVRPRLADAMERAVKFCEDHTAATIGLPWWAALMNAANGELR